MPKSVFLMRQARTDRPARRHVDPGRVLPEVSPAQAVDVEPFDGDVGCADADDRASAGADQRRTAETDEVQGLVDDEIAAIDSRRDLEATAGLRAIDPRLKRRGRGAGRARLRALTSPACPGRRLARTTAREIAITPATRSAKRAASPPRQGNAPIKASAASTSR